MAPEGTSDEPVVSGCRSVRFVCVYVSVSLGVGGRVGGASLASGSFVWWGFASHLWSSAI